MTGMEVRVGTAGWNLPRDVRDEFDASGTHLERYASRFSCVEINSTFHRPHRPSTYARWAASVPNDFRFALKMPKEITHTLRLTGAAEPLARFLDDSAALGKKRDVLLVQLPPSFAYDASVVEPFLESLRALYGGKIACEPRHLSWFRTDVEAVFERFAIARVAADPAIAGATFAPGGSLGFQYFRLHGSPRVYYSSYDDARLAEVSAMLLRAGRPAWCIFDNTALGSAMANALAVLDAVR